MKKIFRILFLFFICTRLAYAQSSDPVFHFGLKAVPNMGWIKTDDPDIKSDGSRFNFAYGLITEFRFAENYAFATGLEVAYRGGKTKQELNTTIGDTTRNTVIESTLKLQYLELPITLKLKTNEIGYLRYFLQVGVAPGIKIRARGDSKVVTATSVSGTSIGQTSTEEENKDIKSDVNTLNMSMIISGGIEYNISGNTNLMLGLVFNNGFLDIDDSDYKLKSNYLGLSIGVLF